MITTTQSVTLSKRATPCLTVAGFPNHWPILLAGEASGIEANRISTKPSGWILLTLTCSRSTRFPISSFVVFPKRCESLIRFSISHRTTSIRLAKADIAQAEGDLPRASALLAPLHPAADDTNVLEAQVYQAILERRPGQVISRVKDVLATPDQALGY